MYEHLVLSGGLIYGYAFYGALKEYHRQGKWSYTSLKSIHSTSVGCVVAIFVAIMSKSENGMTFRSADTGEVINTWDTIDRYLIDRPWQDVFSLSVSAFMHGYDRCGIMDSSCFRDMLLPLFSACDVSIDITLQEFYERFPVELFFMTVCLGGNGNCGSSSASSSASSSPSASASPLSQIVHNVQQQIQLPDEEEDAGSIDIDIMEETGGLNNMGYEQLLTPTMSLNMVYPSLPQLQLPQLPLATEETAGPLPKSALASLVGKLGLQATMDSVDKSNARIPERYGFQYKTGVERLFAPENIGKYSGKIAAIAQRIRESVGIVMIYSQYIDGGLVPMALAMEEMGMTRYVSGDPKPKPLLHASLSSTLDPLDSVTMKVRSAVAQDEFRPAQYVMITGDKAFSHDNVSDLRALNHADNRYGAHIKVVLISKAAAEGLDFKNIRQIHVMEPWYNLNRIEQIIGRGVRNLSHCALPFEERNVEIYMHTTSLASNTTLPPISPAPGTVAETVATETAAAEPVIVGGVTTESSTTPLQEIVSEPSTTPLQETVLEPSTTPPPEIVSEPEEAPLQEIVSEPEEAPLQEIVLEPEPEEAVDTYIYRMAYRKSSKIGQVSRLIKTTAVDCVLNIAQTHFTADKLQQLVANQRIPIRLSSGRGQEIVYQMGDKPYTDLCDYQSSCEFQCTGAQGTQGLETDRTTYTQLHTHTNLHQIMDRIRKLFRESVYYHQVPLIRAINIQREYPIDHIYTTLTYMIENHNEMLVDQWGRNGYLVNRGDVYLFQPIEITDETVSLYDRTVPVDYRRERIILDVPATVIPFRTDVLGPVDVPVPGKEAEAVEEAEAVGPISSIEAQLEIFTSNVDRAMSGEPPAANIPTKEWDWYSHAATVLDDDWKRLHGWKDADLHQIIVEHAVESLMPMERLHLVTQGAAAAYKPLQTYLDERWVASTRPGDMRHGWWILTDDAKNPIQLFVSPTSGTGPWTNADPEDVAVFPISISVPKLTDLTHHVGFFSIFNHKQMVFKVRDMTNIRNKGARMDSAGKIRVIELINLIQDEVEYTNQSTKNIHQNSICVMIEVLMRRPRPDQKRAFLSPEEAILL